MKYKERNNLHLEEVGWWMDPGQEAGVRVPCETRSFRWDTHLSAVMSPEVQPGKVMQTRTLTCLKSLPGTKYK